MGPGEIKDPGVAKDPEGSGGAEGADDPGGSGGAEGAKDLGGSGGSEGSDDPRVSRCAEGENDPGSSGGKSIYPTTAPPWSMDPLYHFLNFLPSYTKMMKNHDKTKKKNIKKTKTLDLTWRSISAILAFLYLKPCKPFE